MTLVGTCKTDGGKMDAGFVDEKNDCTVRAYAIAAEIPYLNAYAELLMAGRKPKKGFQFTKWANDKGWQQFPRPHMTVENYINTVIKPIGGNWIVLVRGHVFAVINGVIHDNLWNPTSQHNRHVLLAWKVK